MSATTIGLNSPQAVKRWANGLAVMCHQESFFERFIGNGMNNIIERRTDLESAEGDEIRFDLVASLREAPTLGDNILEGNEEALNFYQDKVRIDQMRKAVHRGGRMTQQRTVHDLRSVAKDKLGEYLAKWQDEMMFTYLSGDVGITAINQDKVFGAEFANNSITAPDSAHIAYGGAATSKGSMVAGDKMTVGFVERLATKAQMMNSTDVDVADMSPVSIDGEKHFVMVMSPYQAYDLRVETGDISWSKIQQAATTAEGRKNPIFKGGLGMIANVVLQSHRGVRRYSDYGVGAPGVLPAARALFLGRQAGVIAYGGSKNKTRLHWVEGEADLGNRTVISAGAIMGFKKATFNGRDLGVIAADTAAKAA